MPALLALAAAVLGGFCRWLVRPLKTDFFYAPDDFFGARCFAHK